MRARPGAGRRALGLTAVALAACRDAPGRGAAPPAARADSAVAAERYPVVWHAELALASQADAPRRLAAPNEAEEVVWTLRCAGRDPASCAPAADTTRTCDAFRAAEARGASAVSRVDLEGIAAVGIRCRAIEAAGAARPAARSAVRAFALSPAALDALPADVALVVGSEDSARVAAAARTGRTLRGLDPALAGTVEVSSPGDTVLRGTSPDQIVLVRVLARGDFDGDGWDDLLAPVTTGVVGGTFTAQHLYVLTRRSEGTPLRVVTRLR